MIPRVWRADRRAPRILTLNATPVSTSQINLSWSVQTGNIGLAGFRVLVDGALYLQINNPNVTGSAVTGLTANTQYAFAIAPFDTQGREYAAEPVVRQFTQVPATGPGITVSAVAPTATATGAALASGGGITVNAAAPVGSASGGSGGGGSGLWNSEATDTIYLIQGQDATTNLEELIPGGAYAVYSMSTMPGGVTSSGKGFSGLPTTPGVYSVVFRALSPSGWELDEWNTRGTLMGSDAKVRENFPFTTRAQLMSYLSTREGPQNGNKYPDTGWSPGDDGYRAVPVGEHAKIDLAPAAAGLSGRGVRLQFDASEASNSPPLDQGPTIEFAIPSPTTDHYEIFDLIVDQAVLDHDYQSSHIKLLFVNDLGPSNGQIVRGIYFGRRPWIGGYHYTGSPNQFRNVFTGLSFYGGSTFQLYSGRDLNPGAAIPTTQAAFEQRFGPNFDNDSASDPDFASVPRLVGGIRMTLVVYVSYSFVGSSSRGFFKEWLGFKGQPLNMIGCMFRDLNFLNPATYTNNSFRLTFRPEDSTSGNPVTAGVTVGEAIYMSGQGGTRAPIMSGNNPLPFPGLIIPPGFPIANTSDE